MPTDFLAGLITMAVVRKTLVTTRKKKKKLRKNGGRVIMAKKKKRKTKKIKPFSIKGALRKKSILERSR